MSNEILLSFIIPVYNTAEYLSECLNSIINQNFKNIEIICINDGSTDNSLKILEQYQNEYPYIRIINQSNKGVGHARNEALQAVSGRYIVFVDSDDYIDKHLMAAFLSKIDTSADIIIFGAKNYDTRTKHLYAGRYSSRYFKKKFEQKDMFLYHTISCNKIYKKSFLGANHIQFGTTKTGEDQIFTVKSMLLAKKIEIIKKDLYIYRRNRKNSLSYNKEKKDLSPINTVYEIEKFITENKICEDLSKKVLNKYMLKAFSWYGKTNKEFTDKYYKELKILYDVMRSKKGRYWWDYYTLRKNNSYILIKLEYFKALILYFLHEKLIIIPAGLLFFLHIATEIKKEHK